MISLSRRITLGTVGLTCVTVGLSVATVWTAARWQAVRQMDTQLAEHADHLRFLSAGPGLLPPPPLDVPRPMRKGTGWIFVELSQDGEALMRSPSLDGVDGSLADALRQLADGEPGWAELDGRRLRGLRIVFDGVLPSGRSGRVTACIAHESTADQAEAERLAVVLAAVWLSATLAALLTAWWLRRSVIGPIRRLEGALRRIDPERPRGDMAFPAPRELASMLGVLDGTLVRLAEVLAREKRTIANFAHELRSPISGLRTTLEVAALTGSLDGQTVAARCLPTVIAMQNLVANLLTLARLESGLEPLSDDSVELDPMIDGIWAALAPVAAGREQALVREGTGGIVRTASGPASVMLANLLDNAVSHAPVGSDIRLVCTVSGDRLVVAIANPIEGEAPDQRRLAEPLWRADPARSDPQHAGLGLALARRISDLLGTGLRFAVADRSYEVKLEFRRG